ncbi:class F sortase [Streptomyces sp. NPDC014622]|uniref:class F sortase n=1 Tax=Streptomyces sp. NPDC014622 TaxID=3364874 RepID=UPI0036FBE85B
MFRALVPLRRAVLPALVCLALAGCSSGGAHAPSTAHDGGDASYPATVPGATDSAGNTASENTNTPGKTGTAPRPTHVSIPSIGVDSDVMRLGLNADGTVEVPPAEKGMTVGWYTGNPAPGERGAAVLIGHNDTRFGKAVFHDLKKIAEGADIAVRNDRGAELHFRVTGTETVGKKAFPAKKVYGATDERALRLITCDGAFDAEGHPVDNLIVYATRS